MTYLSIKSTMYAGSKRQSLSGVSNLNCNLSEYLKVLGIYDPRLKIQSYYYDAGPVYFRLKIRIQSKNSYIIVSNADHPLLKADPNFVVVPTIAQIVK
jgi:hypothetical protein